MKWMTSIGTLKRPKVGNLDMRFPSYSRPKIFSFYPDIIKFDNDVDMPMFDLIIGIETLANMGVTLMPYKAFKST
jgi:hypothetical protein